MTSENNNPKELTYEMIMQMFAETRKLIEDSSIRQEKYSLQSEKDWEEIRKQMKEVRKEIGGIAHSNGAMAEEMVYNALDKNKTFGKIKFDNIKKNIQLQSEYLETKGEIDLVMLNCNSIALLEVKYKVEKKDLKKLLTSKLPCFREYLPQFNNHKIILGIGGMSFDADVEEEAIKNGIGIIKIVGDNVEFFTENIKVF